MDKIVIIWLVLLIIFLIAEAATVTITSLWFAAGALVALIAGALGAKFWVQMVLFLVVAAVMLIALRPIIKKHFTPKLTPTNVDAIIGKRGVVCADIDADDDNGRVMIDGLDWRAKSVDNETLPKGTKIEVVDRDSVILTVKRL